MDFRRLFEAGIPEKLFNDPLPLQARYEETLKRPAYDLSDFKLSQLVLIFYFLIAGLILSGFVLVFEMIIAKCSTKPGEKTPKSDEI